MKALKAFMAFCFLGVPMDFKKGVFALVLSMLVNSLLIAFMYFINYGSKKVVYSTEIPSTSIRFVTLNPLKKEERKRERRKERKIRREKPKIKLKTYYIKESRKNPIKKPSLPQISFHINPDISTGIAIPPPPSEKKLKTTGYGRGLGFLESEVDQPPVLIAGIKPLYPYRARRLGIEGIVVVKLLVDEKGKVKDVKILRSEPKGVFENAVIRAAKLWRFMPAKENGRNVPCWVIKPIRFRLE